MIARFYHIPPTTSTPSSAFTGHAPSPRSSWRYGDFRPATKWKFLYDKHILEQEDGTLYALTPTGAFHIAQLHLNRPALIAHRLVERHLQLAHQELLALRQRLAELQTEEEEVRRQEEDLGRT